MKTRNLIGICALALAMAATASPAGAAVSVYGGGLARDCYMAVENHYVSTVRALEVCDLALEQERLTRKNRAATLVNRGILHMRDGRHERARVDFERSLAIAPDLLEAKVNLGAALFNMERIDEALTMLNEGVNAESIDAQSTAYYNRALVHLRKDNVEQAYYDFRKALEINPRFTDAARQLERFQVIEAQG